MKIPSLIRLRTDIPISRSAKDESGTQVFQALSVTNGNLTNSCFDGEVKTLYEGFQRGLRISRKSNCLGWRESQTSPYLWLNYEQVEAKAKVTGSGLLATGLNPGSDCRIGIWSMNTPQYAIVMQGCFMYSISIVPLYETLGPDAVFFIINHASLPLVVVDDPSKAKTLLSRVSEIPTLKTIVVTKSIPSEVSGLAETSSIQLMNIKDLMSIGQSNERQVIPPRPEDEAIVCFTSGTTGNPKGAMLTHKNYCTTLGSVLQSMEIVNLDHTDVIISYLPLAHIFEQLMEAVMLMLGASIGYYRGDVKTLTLDMQELKPTCLPIVPRLLNRMYDNAQALAASSAIKSKLFAMGLKKKQSILDKGRFTNDTIWDKLIFKKLKDRIGGRVKLVLTGSAPLSEPVMRFARCAMGAMVLEGYGQTECMGVCTMQLPGEIVAGEVGTPHPGNMIKLVDVPEMDYFAKDRKGEICVKGDNVFAGYLNDEEKTKEAIDEDGWLHTGDIGVMTERGTLKIIDRKKHIFKLSQGEYLAPEKIENVYIRCNLVAQIMVYGNSLKSSAVAIIVPEEEQVMLWAEKTGMAGESFTAIAQDPTLKKEILTAILAIGKADGLKSFEQVRDIHLSNQLWTVDNDFLTPTFKTKRPALTKHFKDVIDQMYEKLD